MGRFVAAFNEQCFLEPIVQKKALEFANLVRGGSIQEYAKKFSQLKCFALKVLANKNTIADKCFWGLRPKLRSKITMVLRNNITEVINSPTT